MGYDVARFLGDVENDVICPICREVLEDPLQVPECEHAFCKDCIQEWLTRQTWCPIDRGELVADRLKPVPRILRNLLSKLDISCDNAKYGCQVWTGGSWQGIIILVYFPNFLVDHPFLHNCDNVT
jgi:E3 ubiquitin-protein ligase NRDP1